MSDSHVQQACPRPPARLLPADAALLTVSGWSASRPVPGSLPLLAQLGGAASYLAVAAEESTGRSTGKSDNKHVLIVEDDEDIRETLQLALEMEGFEVSTAGDGRQALDLLGRMPRPTLILLDLMMPVMDGWQFVTELEKSPRLASIPVVVATAFSDSTKPIRAAALLKKPLDLDVLIDTIQKHRE